MLVHRGPQPVGQLGRVRLREEPVGLGELAAPLQHVRQPGLRDRDAPQLAGGLGVRAAPACRRPAPCPRSPRIRETTARRLSSRARAASRSAYSSLSVSRSRTARSSSGLVDHLAQRLGVEPPGVRGEHLLRIDEPAAWVVALVAHVPGRTATRAQSVRRGVRFGGGSVRRRLGRRLRARRQLGFGGFRLGGGVPARRGGFRRARCPSAACGSAAADAVLRLGFGLPDRVGRPRRRQLWRP